MMAVRNPGELNPPVWPPPRSLATTSGISVDVFSWPYLDVSVQAVPLVHLFDSMHDVGSPIRKSTDIADICSSPWLIAACHVLLRLLMPRHSPCALSSLTELVAKSAQLRFRRQPPALAKNCARSLAPRFPREPACAGLRSEKRRENE